MKYAIKRTTQFKKDCKLAIKRGGDMDKLKEVITMLANGEEFPEKYKVNDCIIQNNTKM